MSVDTRPFVQSSMRFSVYVLQLFAILVIGAIPATAEAQMRTASGEFEITQDSINKLFGVMAAKKPLVIIDNVVSTLEVFQKLPPDTVVTVSYFDKTSLLMKRLIERHGPDAEKGVFIVATGPLTYQRATLVLGFGRNLTTDSLEALHKFVAKQKPTIMINNKVATLEEFKNLDKGSIAQIRFMKPGYFKQQNKPDELKKRYDERVLNGVVDIGVIPGMR